jgi:hypothetical protein
MTFTVKAIGETEQKSAAQVEDELLKKHEEKQAEVVVEHEDIDDNKVIEFIDRKYNKKVSSIEDLFKVEKEELPEDVSAFLNFKKETGRGLKDFMKANRDLNEDNPDAILREYYEETEKGLDGDDIESLISEKFHYDEDLDDDKDIKRKQREKKKEIAKAKEYLESQKQKYKAPLESSYGALSDEDKNALAAYKQYMDNSNSAKEQDAKATEWFLKKTDEVFNQEFKGFEFKIGDKSLKFSPGDSQELKKSQSNINNFIKKFLDENGLIKDAAGYHRSLSIAMNPEKFAKFFYEQGASDSSDDFTKRVKNVNFETRGATQARSTGSAFKVQAVGNDSGRGLKIKLKK